jgi:pseudouridine-5'-phosphate glycosidase
VLVCVPPPSPLPRAEVEGALSAALSEAGERKLAGKALTPFLLARLAEWSGGRTLQSNLDLLERNAGRAGEIAAAFAARQVT